MLLIKISYERKTVLEWNRNIMHDCHYSMKREGEGNWHICNYGWWSYLSEIKVTLCFYILRSTVITINFPAHVKFVVTQTQTIWTNIMLNFYVFILTSFFYYLVFSCDNIFKSDMNTEILVSFFKIWKLKYFLFVCSRPCLMVFNSDIANLSSNRLA